jgi:hypothetical protein
VEGGSQKTGWPSVEPLRLHPPSISDPITEQHTAPQVWPLLMCRMLSTPMRRPLCDRGYGICYGCCRVQGYKQSRDNKPTRRQLPSCSLRR